MAITPHNNGVDYVEFAAPDFAPIRAFYGSAFGWEFVDYGPDYLAFDDGRLAGGFRKGDATSGTTLVILYASDLEATEKSVRDAGGKISAEIFSFPGGRRFEFKDPAGNDLAVWSDK